MELGRSSKSRRIRDGANVVDAESVRVTLSMTTAEREALREIAKARGTTVSGLIQSWVDERCDVVPAVADPRIGVNIRQRMDGLVLLGCLGDESAACAFFDPQYRGLLDKLDYGTRARGGEVVQPGGSWWILPPIIPITVSTGNEMANKEDADNQIADS